MVGPQSALRVRDFLGVFYQDGGVLFVADEHEGARNVEEELTSYLGQEVRVLAHHRPVEPHLPSRWGGGCCMLEGSGFCPFGHHTDPSRIFSLNEKGVLERRNSDWVLVSRDGETKCLFDLLIGHRSQIVVTTIPDFDRIEEKVRSFDPSTLEHATLEELTSKLTDLREYLAEINQLKNNIDG